MNPMVTIPITLSPEEHDFSTAAISHLPHLISASLVNLVNAEDNEDEILKTIAAGGFRDITRISSSSPIMWQNICLSNRDEILKLMNLYKAQFAKFEKAVSDSDPDELMTLFSNAKDYRDSLPVRSKGALAPSYEFYLDVEDEPGAGSDAGGVSTRAVHNKEEGTYTLNGTKMFITNGGLAEIFLVFANTRKTGGIRGLTAFIVPKDTPGFSVGKKENKMGIRPSNTTELVLQDVVIPESYRVGREGEGFRIAMNTLDSARPFVGAVSVGIAQAALDYAVKYAKERRQFGQPIASFQMVQGTDAHRF